jgi:hypothetical protein
MFSGWTTTDRKLSEYSIFTGATTISLLMVPYVNYKTPEVLDRFFKFNVSLLHCARPDCAVRGELADIPSVWSAERNVVPPKLPGDDEVQASICDMLEKEMGLYKEAAAEDKAEREAALDAKMRARFHVRKSQSLQANRTHREAKEGQRVARLQRMEERARELADAMVPFVPAKKKKKKPRRRAAPPPPPSVLYMARAAAALALRHARAIARRAPLAARNIALAGKEAVKDFYIRKLQRTIADEADQVLLLN